MTRPQAELMAELDRTNGLLSDMTRNAVSDPAAPPEFLTATRNPRAFDYLLGVQVALLWAMKLDDNLKPKNSLVPQPTSPFRLRSLDAIRKEHEAARRS